ncbi:plant intracellular Ras-group-related LRR protein 1-like [Cryptomeria japonica]|uniref:plant intracellular Ras-group-related LRR protein 1-like n=1 Tax=Cryptomeria japonica TaxID=3369 RepID=UPI0027D9E0F5|nr:plant intracellular Ras-group-related LRR protein 1-like [Cryptomeria japonica]
MAGITRSNERDLVVNRLQNDATNSLYGKLRLSYDALADVAGCGIALQLCFLCIAAYPEDNIISPTYATAYWIGEGLVTGPKPFQIGEITSNRCKCRKMLLSARQRLTAVSSGRFFMIQISEEVIGSMTSLRVLDLSRTALQLLPKNMPCLKHLVFLRLCYVPIKRLPNTVAALKSLQILDLEGSDISQRPVGISKLTSLKALDIGFCEDLQCMPFGITHLTSLEYLNTHMQILPHAMTAMSKLKELYLQCPQLLQKEVSFCEFQHLRYIKLIQCSVLKHLPALRKPRILMQLEIVKCTNMEKLPEEFGKVGIFPKLDMFTVVKVEKMEQLPKLEGALPSLKTLTIVKCEALERIPQCYWNLKSVEKIRVYGCSKVQHVISEEEDFIRTKTKVLMIRVSNAEIQALEERYFEIRHGGGHFYYVEFWCNEVFRFLEFAMSSIIQTNRI